jgi:hypothetical protein
MCFMKLARLLKVCEAAWVIQVQSAGVWEAKCSGSGMHACMHALYSGPARLRIARDCNIAKMDAHGCMTTYGMKLCALSEFRLPGTPFDPAVATNSKALLAASLLAFVSRPKRL